MVRLFGLFLAIGIAANTIAQAPPEVTSTSGKIKVEKLATLEFPWGMAVLPDGRLLITEKTGKLRIWQNGKLSEPLAGVPKGFRHSQRDQGGLMDVEADPEFAINKTIYLSYTETATNQSPELAETDDFRFGSVDLTDNVLRGGVVASAHLEENGLRDVKVIWRQTPKTVGRGHFGNRIVFSKDGKMFITSGDRMRFEPAQSLESNLGKVLRINKDGSTPEDNPFASQQKARKDIWSYGHRNILSAAFEPETDRLWVVEMGPLGGDELNLVERGQNYGWPLASDGEHYKRATVTNTVTIIPNHPSMPAFRAPVRSWTPVISPSGAAFYTGTLFKDWKGSLLVGGLSSRALIRLVLEGNKVAVEERIDLRSRIRDVLPAPDGSIWLIVDDKEGNLLRLTPAAG